MGHWLRDDDKFEVVIRFIKYPMMFARLDIKPLPFANINICTVFFERGRSIENKEKLLCVSVKVEGFFRARWHIFLDYTQGIRFHEVPTIAIIAPLVMWRMLFND